MTHSIAVAINYCTNDYKFIGLSLKQIKKFSSNIIVTYTDHFFNGEPENLSLIKETIKENLEAKFIEIKYRSIKPPISDFLCRLIPRSTNLRPLYGPHYWACMARFIGYQQMSKIANYLLFLDTDEIVDGQRFKQWLDAGEYQSLEAMTFACYFYFRNSRLQAKTWEECGLLIKNAHFNKKDFLSHYDRRNLFRKAHWSKKSGVLGLDARPMFHHYAWVRNKKEMLDKVRTWGHSREQNWTKLVEEEFSHDFSGSDFVHGYKYKKVEPFISFQK